jgi:hypothetical protein
MNIMFLAIIIYHNKVGNKLMLALGYNEYGKSLISMMQYAYGSDSHTRRRLGLFCPYTAHALDFNTHDGI